MEDNKVVVLGMIKDKSELLQYTLSNLIKNKIDHELMGKAKVGPLENLDLQVGDANDNNDQGFLRNLFNENILHENIIKDKLLDALNSSSTKILQDAEIRNIQLNNLIKSLSDLETSNREIVIERIDTANNDTITKFQEDRTHYMEVSNKILDKLQQNVVNVSATLIQSTSDIMEVFEPQTEIIHKLSFDLQTNDAQNKKLDRLRQRQLVEKMSSVTQRMKELTNANKVSRGACIPDWPLNEWDPNRADKVLANGGKRLRPKNNAYGVYGNYFRYFNLDHSVQSLRFFFERVLGYRPHTKLPKPFPSGYRSYLPMRRFKWEGPALDLTEMTNQTVGMGFLNPTDYQWCNVMFSDGEYEANSDVAMFSWYGLGYNFVLCN